MSASAPAPGPSPQRRCPTRQHCAPPRRAGAAPAPGLSRLRLLQPRRRRPGLAGFANTATRVLWGTISLRSSSRLPGSSALRKLKPVMLPSGRARLATKSLPNWISGARHHDRDRACGVLGRADCWQCLVPQSRPPGAGPTRPPARGAALLFPSAIPGLNDEILALRHSRGRAAPAVRPLQWREDQGGEMPALSHPMRCTFVAGCAPVGKRRHEQAQGECDEASDGAAPHDHLLKSVSSRPSSCHGSRTLRFRRAQWLKRRRSGSYWASPASGGSAWPGVGDGLGAAPGTRRGARVTTSRCSACCCAWKYFPNACTSYWNLAARASRTLWISSTMGSCHCVNPRVLPGYK